MRALFVHHSFAYLPEGGRGILLQQHLRLSNINALSYGFTSTGCQSGRQWRVKVTHGSRLVRETFHQFILFSLATSA